MEWNYIFFSSALLVLAAVAAADPEPWDNNVYRGRDRGHSGYFRHSGYGHLTRHSSYKPKRKTIKCYQCAYSPGKTGYKEIHEPITVRNPHNPYERKVEYRVRKVAVKKSGGWDKCLGPFNDYQAKAFGVDVWDCHDNCYTRIDAYGNLFRGCYKGEYNVDPNHIGCTKQNGDVYCFCKGDKCNNAGVQGFGKGGHRY